MNLEDLEGMNEAVFHNGIYPEVYVPVSMRGMSLLARRCDTQKLDVDDTSTWGDVNWLSYRFHDGALWVIKHSYEGQITGAHP